MTEAAIRVQIASMQQERDKAVDRGFKSLIRRREFRQPPAAKIS